MHERLSDQQIEQIHQRLEQVLSILETRYDVNLPPLTLELNVRGTAWGYYTRKGKQCSVRLNPALCAEHFEETLNDVIPHELAHFAVDQMYARRRKPHGPEWQKVMQALGITQPRVTHGKDVSHLATRKQRRHPYRCDCQLHWLSSTRHNRIGRGQQQYFCRQCGGPLQASPDDARD